MNKKVFDAKKTFGLSVLLKLTRTSVEGVEISESNGRYTSSQGMEEVARAVTQTMETHNISLRLK